MTAPDLSARDGAPPSSPDLTDRHRAAGLAAAVPTSASIGLWVGSSGGTPLSATHTVDVLAIRNSWSGAL